MSLLVVGLSHRSAPVSVLERAAVAHSETRKVLEDLLQCDDVGAALLLSTCNRIEVYAEAQTFHGALADISGVLARQAGMPLEDLSGHLYVHYAGAGVEHLFSVASGLDSMVVGEPQILGQLRTAYADAEEAGTLGRTLHEVSQQALRVGKRVHTETGIATEGASVVSEALADAAAALAADGGGGLAGRRALVIGTGSMGGLAAAQLRRAEIGEIVLANRTLSSAQRLATQCAAQGTPARAIGLDAVPDALAAADLVLCCTGAVGAVLGVEHVARARTGTEATEATESTGATARLVVCDLGLPRDVEAGVGELPGVTLLDLTTLQHRLTGGDRAGAAGRDSATEQAYRIVADEVSGYLATQRTMEVTPTVAALRQRAAEVVDAELLRLDGKLPDLAPGVREELGRTVRRVVDKLLHTPTVRVKQLAETGGGEAYADALRELFGLDPQTAAAVSATVRPISTTDPSAQSSHSAPDGGTR